VNETKARQLSGEHIIVAVTVVVTLAGCSDRLAPDLEACKAKATKAELSEQERATYLRKCMHAQGWPVKDACLDTPDRWDSPECYLK
jgi:hypothetical protein